MKFNVGDRVRVVKVCTGGNFEIGDVVTIKEVIYCGDEGKEKSAEFYSAVSPHDNETWYLCVDEIEEEDKTAEWIIAVDDFEDGMGNRELPHCSRCNRGVYFHDAGSFCPFCGSLMRNPKR